MAYGERLFFCLLFVSWCLTCSFTVFGQEDTLECIYCHYKSNSLTKEKGCVDKIPDNETHCGSDEFCVTHAKYNKDHTEAIEVYRGCASESSDVCVAKSGQEPYCEVTCKTKKCNTHDVMAMAKKGFSKDTATICTTLAPSLLILTIFFTLAQTFSM